MIDSKQKQRHIRQGKAGQGARTGQGRTRQGRTRQGRAGGGVGVPGGRRGRHIGETWPGPPGR